MPKLNEDQKVFIITRLACFQAPSLVAADFSDEYGIALTSSHVQCYDPEKKAGENLLPQWKQFFFQTREAFMANKIFTAISIREVRVESLARIATRAERAGNYKMALKALEQAAKEQGDVYTNKVAMDIEANGSFILQGGLPDVPLGELKSLEDRNRAIAEAKQAREHEFKQSNDTPYVHPDLVEEDQISATASPQERAAWEARRMARREAELGLPTEREQDRVHPEEQARVQSIAADGRPDPSI
jgi:hypothetical protein